MNDRLIDGHQDNSEQYEGMRIHEGIGNTMKVLEHIRTLLALVEMHPYYGTLCEEAEEINQRDPMQWTNEDDNHPGRVLAEAFSHFEEAHMGMLTGEEGGLFVDYSVGNVSFLASCLSDAHRYMQTKVTS